MQCIDNVNATDAACSVARDRHYCLVHTCVSPRNCALDRAQISPWDGEILGARVPAHCKAQGPRSAMVWMRCICSSLLALICSGCCAYTAYESICYHMINASSCPFTLCNCVTFYVIKICSMKIATVNTHGRSSFF